MDDEIVSVTIRWSRLDNMMLCDLVFEDEPGQSVRLLAANAEFLHDHDVNGPRLYKALHEAVQGWLCEFFEEAGGEHVSQTEVGLDPETLIQQGMKKN